MRITVFGATGRTGVHTVRRALDRGHEVTAVVRASSRLPLDHPNLEVATANITSADSLSPVLEGRDAVVSALGARGNKGSGIVSEATDAIMAAMRASRVTRLMVVSAAPVGPTPEGESLFIRSVITPLVRKALAPQYADLAVMERAVIGSEHLKWTVVRPPRLLDGDGTGSYRKALGSNVARGGTIKRADLARALIDMLDDSESLNQVVGVAN
ncbi:SDR family oxidoreductase [Nocardiopsis rhodophaea]|uniref:SDR family oxidoreductase n=1 Tax=Nocardiopsis rhodophaea TaxID=280238 RepID=A0ABP5DPM6_9ACTN